MDAQLTQILDSFPIGYKYFVTSEEDLISCVANYLGDKVIPIVQTSILDDKQNKLLFYSLNPIMIEYETNKIFIRTFTYERYWYMVMGSESLNNIYRFLNTFKIKSTINGYMEYRTNYRGYEYSKGINIIKGLKFCDLIGIDDKRDSVINDIDRYFDNLDKYRAMGVNHGLNYVIHGPPGTGKTSFVLALAHHYHANLFIPGNSLFGSEINTYLNPSMRGICIVLLDDFNSGVHMKDYIHGMFDDGAENIIRIFITNNLTNVNHTPFISRCRRIMNFNPPDLSKITAMISRAFDITEDEALPLANIIEIKESERLTKYNKMKQHIEQVQKKAKEEGVKPKDIPSDPKPFEPIGYRDINYFLSEYIGDKDAINKAITNIDEWVATRGKYIDACDSTSNNECNVM
jgi:hypothetical protein